MSSERDLLEVGYIAKAHGVKGEVTVVLSTDRSERVEPGVTLIGNGIPLTVVSSRPQNDRWLVFFAGVDSRDKAEALRGTTLYAEPIDDSDALWIHQLFGKRVVDQHHIERGIVHSVIANPASDILELDSGALVPLTFVESTDADTIVIRAPEGLFDLE